MARHENELLEFTRQALAQGQHKSEVDRILREAGWSQDEVHDALASFADVEFPVPVPRPRPQPSAWEAFLYLLLFTTLYSSAYSLGSLLFEFIELAFPDPASRAVWAPSQVRWAISTLVIAFPVFAYVTMRIAHLLSADPTRRGSPVRKWLTYIAALIAALIVIGDLVALVYSVLSGELTIRFVLKAVVVGAIAGGIFTYYLSGLRQGNEGL